MNRNVADSVHQRLLNLAREEGRPFNELLQYFVLERFLYRLGHSRHRDLFVLKGALMFGVWQGPLSRATRDVDLLGRLENTVERCVAAIRTICDEPVLDDGLRFDAETARGEYIIEAANYRGVRVRFRACLGSARISCQVDLGFGDPVVPCPVRVRLPTVLNLPAPELLGYTRESTIAEKYQAMIYLGELNSRMKDFYDIWLLASNFEFEGEILALAIRETLHSRGTTLPSAPVALSDGFAHSQERQAHWEAFIRRLQIPDAPTGFQEVVTAIAGFLQPMSGAIVGERAFPFRWSPGGPWAGISGDEPDSQ